MLDRVTGMLVFVRVATHGSFSAAARALNLSQTMATKHVAAIEERLGVKLFHRSTRRLTLTEAGRHYLASCERILPDIDEAESSARADHLEPRGTLRLNVPLAFGVREIAPALAEFARLHPALSIDLGLSDRQVDLIDEGWDLAVRIARLQDSSLVARWLAPCRVLVCAAPSYLAARGTPRRLADLAMHNCLGYTLPNPASAERWVFGANAEIAVPVAGNLRASNGDALLAAALAGQGLIYQPTFLVADGLRSGDLVALPLDQPTRVLPINAILPSGRQPPAKVRAFVEFLARRFRPDPPWDRGLDLSPAGT
jgi:DNA-binding transcriptional LysR family regulator